MEFNEKLQELRKKKGLTQDELAQCLYVSRTAVSKWESGRGYPNIDSLKGIARFFSVTVDELLSSDEILDFAEENGLKKERHLRTLVIGLADICMALLFFLPVFAQRQGEDVLSVTLISLEGVAVFLKALYFVCITVIAVFGVAIISLQNANINTWERIKNKISLGLSAASLLLFALSLHPYAVVFTFALLIIKGLILIKWQ